MLTETSKKAFLEPDDLVDMGLFRDTGHVFRAIKNQTNVPPHVRLSKKNIRFPSEDFRKWLLEQTEGPNDGTQYMSIGEHHEDKLEEGAKKRKHLKNPKDKVEVVMKEYKRGTLHSGSGDKVKNRKQAIAIALSEAGKSKKKS